MSASDWDKCPKCVAAAKAKQARRARKAKAAYGKVSDEEYQVLLRRAKRPVNVPNHLREDYSQGIGEDGMYRVTYRASCADCDFEFSYSHESRAFPTNHEAGE